MTEFLRRMRLLNGMGFDEQKAEEIAKDCPPKLYNNLIKKTKYKEEFLKLYEAEKGRQLILNFDANSTGIETKLINVEANFLRIFPYLTEYKREKFPNEIIIKRTMTNKEGEKIKTSLSITKSDKTKWPGPLAGKFLEVLDQLLDKEYQKNGFIENPIIYNRGTICTIAKMPTEGVSKALKDEVENLHGIHFHSDKMYYYKEKERYVRSSEKSWYPFPRIEDVTVKNSTGKEITQYSKIWLDEKFISNYNKNYLGKVDSDFALSLEIPLARKLYRLLSGAFYAWNEKTYGGKKEYIPYYYNTLCDQLIIIRREVYHYDKVLQFKPAIEELKERSYLGDKSEWMEKKKGKDSLVRFWPGKRVFAENRERKRRLEKFHQIRRDEDD